MNLELNINIDRFYESIISKAPLGADEISDMESAVNQYPYFQQAIFLYLQSLYKYDYERYEVELERLSVNVRDRKALFYFIFGDEFGDFLNKTGRDISKDKTAVLLDAFFTASSAEDDVFDNSVIDGISLATSDYFIFLSQDVELTQENGAASDIPVLKHQGLIDDFIERSKTGDIHIKLNREDYRDSVKDTYNSEESETEDETLSHDIFFTETLAKIYIKQKRYEKAYKIIKHLSLNYPKKNTYFADQLNFLEKLIINSKYKDKK